jgi:hypothetical protein
MIQALLHITSAGAADIVILSDANHIFIEKILEVSGWRRWVDSRSYDQPKTAGNIRLIKFGT